MKTLEKLESSIGDIIVQIEENNRIDRITKEKLIENISALWNLTGELKEEKENNWNKVNDLLSSL